MIFIIMMMLLKIPREHAEAGVAEGAKDPWTLW
jgi:hypothetical protein